MDTALRCLFSLPTKIVAVGFLLHFFGVLFSFVVHVGVVAWTLERPFDGFRNEQKLNQEPMIASCQLVSH